MDFGPPPQIQSPNLSWVYQLAGQNPQAKTSQQANQLLQAMAQWKQKNQLQSMQQQLMGNVGGGVSNTASLGDGSGMSGFGDGYGS